MPGRGTWIKRTFIAFGYMLEASHSRADSSSAIIERKSSFCTLEMGCERTQGVGKKHLIALCRELDGGLPHNGSIFSPCFHLYKAPSFTLPGHSIRGAGQVVLEKV